MLLAGLGLALASAFATNLGFLFRHRGAVAAPDVDARRPLRSAIELFRSKWWRIGYGVAAIAYGLHVGALALAPLSVVQAVLAAGLVVLGAAAGLLFTVTHVAVKAATGLTSSGLTMVALLLGAVLAAIVAFFASARSLQVGEAVAVIAVTSVASNASAIPAGVVVFADPIGHDASSVVLRSLAFVLVIVAAALIPAPTRTSRSRGRAREPSSAV